MKLFSYIACVASMAGLTFAVLAWRLNRRARLNRALAACGLFNALWTGCLVVVYGADDLSAAFLFYKIGYIGEFGLNVAMGAMFLELAGVPARWQRVVVGIASAGALAIAAGYIAGGFPWSALSSGPWGNTGVADQNNSWSEWSDIFFIGLDVVYLACLGRAAFTSESARRRRNIRVMLLGIVCCVFVYTILGIAGLSSILPVFVFIPGEVVLAIVLYDAVKLRSLQPDTPRFGEALSETWPVPALLIDRQRKVIGANGAAREQGAVAGLSLTGKNIDELFAERERSRFVINESFDQFGDLVGSVVLMPSTSSRVPWPDTLSSREVEVLTRIVRGLSNKDIADELFVSEGTVKTHVHNILKKTGCENREQLFLRWGRIVE